MADGRGLSANLNVIFPLENADPVQGIVCFISMGNNLLFTANLQPYVYDVHFSSSPRIFMRLPNDHQNFYTGMLHRGHMFPDWAHRHL